MLSAAVAIMLGSSRKEGATKKKRKKKRTPIYFTVNVEFMGVLFLSFFVYVSFFVYSEKFTGEPRSKKRSQSLDLDPDRLHCGKRTEGKEQESHKRGS